MNSYDLAGRTAIITGGAGGFGCAIAKQLLAAGAAVSLWDVAADRLETSVRQLAAGSLLTYGHVGRPTAPGQLGVAELAAELRRLYPS